MLCWRFTIHDAFSTSHFSTIVIIRVLMITVLYRLRRDSTWNRVFYDVVRDFIPPPPSLIASTNNAKNGPVLLADRRMCQLTNDC